MSKITVWFIKCAMIYFLLAMLLGLHMAVSGIGYPFLPIHVHLNLLGWMSMMIYGVSYHILPRFSGKPLWSDRLSIAHFWLANAGLIGMALGWVAQQFIATNLILLLFSIVEAIAISFFVINMFKTIRSAPPAVTRVSTGK